MTNLTMPEVDFSNLSLSNIDFSGSDLRGVDFSNCMLQDVTFENVSLEGAVFDRSNLESAMFKGVKLNGASFKNCILEKATFDSSMLDSVPYTINGTKYWKRTIFDRSNLSGAVFRSVQFRGVSIQDADLKYSSFIKSTTGVVTENDQIIAPHFVNSEMSYADLRDLDLLYAGIGSSRLDFANLQGANLTRTWFTISGSLWQADLSGANLTKVRVTSPAFNMQGANLEKANLQDADLSRAVFSDSTKFKGAIYNEKTKFPQGFNPKSKGLDLK